MCARIFSPPVSYSTFNVTVGGLSNTDIQLAAADIRAQLASGVAPHAAAPLVDIPFTVTNVGSVSSDYVLTAFTTPVDPPPGSGAPLQSLVGFERVHLAPGQSITVMFPIDAFSLSFANTAGLLDTLQGAWRLTVDDAVVMIHVA